MSVYFDTSAVVALHVDHPARPIALAALVDGTCTSALALTEAIGIIDKLTDDQELQTDLEDALRLQWDRYAVIPVDQRCLDRAAQLLRDQPLRLSDAIHLAAAERLTRPVEFVTFDPTQIPVALSLGFEVTST